MQKIEKMAIPTIAVAAGGVLGTLMASKAEDAINKTMEKKGKKPVNKKVIALLPVALGVASFFTKNKSIAAVGTGMIGAGAAKLGTELIKSKHGIAEAGDKTENTSYYQDFDALDYGGQTDLSVGVDASGSWV